MHLSAGRHARRADAHDAGRGFFSLKESERIATEGLLGGGKWKILEKKQKCWRGCCQSRLEWRWVAQSRHQKNDAAWPLMQSFGIDANLSMAP